jgi:hypothetical protein
MNADSLKPRPSGAYLLHYPDVDVWTLDNFVLLIDFPTDRLVGIQVMYIIEESVPA